MTLDQACSGIDCRSAICVQNFNDSLSCAIRITYRISQRSSSIHEPRDPPLKVVNFHLFTQVHSRESSLFREYFVFRQDNGGCSPC